MGCTYTLLPIYKQVEPNRLLLLHQETGSLSILPGTARIIMPHCLVLPASASGDAVPEIIRCKVSEEGEEFSFDDFLCSLSRGTDDFREGG